MFDDDNDRLISGVRSEEEFDNENILRPKKMEDYIGQDKVKSNLAIFISAANKRGEALDHVLLYGPPGLGKTTLAHIIANEMDSQIKVTSGPAIEKAADLAAIITNLQPNDILFIDEIHRLNRSVEEILYPAMEDFSLDFIIGKGPAARSVRMPLPRFTLIGATTRAGMLTSPLRDRFGVIFRLELYKPEDLQRIIVRSSKLLNISIDTDASFEIAKRSRGTPRIANRLLRRVRDFADYEGSTVITKAIADTALTAMEVDKLGLDYLDRTLLETIIVKYNGGPVGLETLGASMGEEANTIEDLSEPFLLQLGFIARTPRGRVALPKAYEHLKITLPPEKRVQLSIFDTNNGADDE